MSDLNDLNGLPNGDAVEPVSETEAADAQALHDEMEELAKVFQEELDRAKAEAKEVAENAPVDPEIELSETTPSPTPTASETPLSEDELCECCGEKRRGTANNPNSPYCAECDAGLRHYPFDFLNIFFVLVAICFVFYGGYVFADHTETFVAVQKADSLRAAGKPDSALSAYSTAANIMVNSQINGELVYKRAILLAYDTGNIGSMSAPSANIHAWELSLPHFCAVKKALDSAEEITATVQAANALLLPYNTTAPQDIPYEELLAQLDALKTESIPAEQTDGDETETTTADSDAYEPKAERYNSVFLTFYKYYAALMCEKDLGTQIAFMEEIQKDAPDMVWLYAPILAELYAKTGRDIEPICQLMESFDTEDKSPAVARVIQKRIQGKYTEATALCDEALAVSSNLDTEFYRQKALMLLAEGNYKDAYTLMNNAYEESASPSLLTVYTFALCAAAAGEETTYNEIVEMLTGYGYTVPAELTGYKNGSVTLEQILFEGDYDIA